MSREPSTARQDPRLLLRNRLVWAAAQDRRFRFPLHKLRRLEGSSSPPHAAGHEILRFAARVLPLCVGARHKSLSSGRARRGPGGRARTIGEGLNRAIAAEYYV